MAMLKLWLLGAAVVLADGTVQESDPKILVAMEMPMALCTEAAGTGKISAVNGSGLIQAIIVVCEELPAG